MEALNLPDYTNYIKIDGTNQRIFDIIRKKYLKLTPEEWVRQNFILYLLKQLKYPKGLLAIEMELKLNQLTRRCDIVVFNRKGAPKLIVECKAAHIKINQKTFDQIAEYNLKLRVDFLVVTNGLNHYCCQMDYNNNSYQFIKEIPTFEQILATD